MDLLVQEAQRWLNDTYGHVAGFGRIEITGRTGWPTMYALINALQIELGITALSPAFGPTTMARLDALGPISEATQNKNIVKIVQCGLWCKGYNGGPLTGEGEYSTRVVQSVQQLRTDIGITAGGGSVTTKIFSALLTMNAYVLIPGGDLAVRQVQQWLNSKYWGRKDFYYIPADGYFSRDVQTALMLGIQYEIGMADGVANGNFGPGTQDGLRTQGQLGLGSTDGAKSFVRLFQGAMRFNRQATPFDGIFGQSTANAVAAFQEFAKLSPVSGRADYQTWASLLVSTGDPSRPVSAMDCMTPFNAARAAAVRAHGFDTAGRYLTGGANKRLTDTELQIIFDAGLSVFPIYQFWNNDLIWFDFVQGAQAGREAFIAARQFGFEADTTIYFAVDYDAQAHEIASNIIPYFQGVAHAFSEMGSPYRVGVYGSRNVCSTISDRGLATYSFVSGMSTGFSGNLGFPLPENWAFDQIANVFIGVNTPGYVEIDRNAKSGRDRGQKQVTRPANVNAAFFAFVDWLRVKAGAWASTHNMSPRQADALVCHYLREPEYGDAKWAPVAGVLNTGFIEEVNRDTTRPRIYTLRDPATGIQMDAMHLAATLNAALYHWPSGAEFTFGDVGGWGGDLVTCLTDYIKDSRGYSTAYDYGMAHIGQSPSTTFGEGDMFEDMDGFNLAWMLSDPDETRDIAQLIRAYYSGTVNRFANFFAGRFGGNAQTAQMVAQTGLSGQPPLTPGVGAYVIVLYVAYGVSPAEITYAHTEGMARAFVDVVRNRI